MLFLQSHLGPVQSLQSTRVANDAEKRQTVNAYFGKYL